MTDLTALNSACSAMKKYLLGTKLNIIIAAIRELQTNIAAIRSAILLMNGNYVIGATSCAIGSTPQNMATGAFSYTISGKLYSKTSVAAGTALGTDVIPQNRYGCVALDIGTDGTLDAISATGNATGYTSAALAVSGLPAPATGHARVGWVTVMESDGDFTFGTSSLVVANSTVAYTDATTKDNAIVATIPSAIAAPAPAVIS